MNIWANEIISMFRFMPSMHWGDVVEILILAFMVYHIMVWIKSSRAWSLLKGVVVIVGFLFLANYFQMETILWISKNVLGFAVTAMIVILQPELRRALEELGNKNILTSIFPMVASRGGGERFSEEVILDLVEACLDMGKTKTGALIVIEGGESLAPVVSTGIAMDALVSRQLLVNIFEHNTPLHDGAVIVRGDRILAATCYLPLSENMSLGKELGTRHRAGVGMSEASDALVLMVSEETGSISVASGGMLERGLGRESLRACLQNRLTQSRKEEKRKPFRKKSSPEGQRTAKTE